MGHNLQDVIAFHGPGKIEKVGTTVRIVHFLSIREDQALAGSQAPHKSNIVFFPSAVGARLSSSQRLRIGETKSPGNIMEKIRKESIVDVRYIRYYL